MKKIGFAVLFLFVMVMLAGCQENTSQTTDSSFTLEVIGLDQTVLVNRNIIFNEDDQTSVVDLIDQAVGLDYTVYDIGIFVNGIGGFYPKEYGVTYNYYFTLYVDDAPATTGIADIIPTDGMNIQFVETTTLDQTDLSVDQIVYDFIANRLNDYVSNDGVSSDVLAAVKLLDIFGYDVPNLSTLKANSSQYSEPMDTIANAFKSTVYELAFDMNTDAVQTALSTMTASNPYDAVSLLTALTMTEGSETQIDSIIETLTTTTPEYMDADYAGMLIRALAPYQDVLGVREKTNDMLDYIKSNLSADGVTSWGNPNASSTAAVIIGLVAQGISPRDALYTTDGTDLIEALISYEQDGAFKWLKTDAQPDVSFSTPQAFASLVVYKIFRDIYGNPAVNLYDF